MADDIRILYNGQDALSTALFAERYDMNIDTARKTLARLGVPPLPKPLDARTKLWPTAAVEEAMGARKGRGANLRGHK